MQSFFCKGTFFSTKTSCSNEIKCCDVFVKIHLQKKIENQADLKLRKFAVFCWKLNLLTESFWLNLWPTKANFQVNLVNNWDFPSKLSTGCYSCLNYFAIEPSPKVPTSTIIHNSNYNCFCQKNVASTNKLLIIYHAQLFVVENLSITLIDKQRVNVQT